MVSQRNIEAGLSQLGLAGQDVAVHSSLRSFGHVNGGADAVVNALLQVCETVLMPAFCEIGRTNPPPDDRPAQNGWDYETYQIDTSDLVPFDPASFDRMSALSAAEMGRIPAAFLQNESTVRSQHPSLSWGANGPTAVAYTASHSPSDPNLPLKRLFVNEGVVLLMGVGLTSCTAVRLAEELAGRRPFIRWVLYSDDAVRRVREYGCSDGFDKLAPYVEALANRVAVGECRMVAYPIKPFVQAIADVIQSRPEITLCGRQTCRCNDAMKGGPVDAGG